MRQLELLAPAKNLACGIAAIDHGADAVYIGAQCFGARAAAGNSVEDIAELCRYAHCFCAKVYVTVNTIIYDNELEEIRQLMGDLQAVGVDAFLIQDMGLVGQSAISKYHLHASTQTDNRSVEKVRWLRSLGFRRVVLARELSVEEIAVIHREVPDVELEVFVHGALCVSYSGVCYASQYCFGRSANRGSCAQFCRLKFDLRDADNQLIEQQRHLLSLKDMCRISYMEKLIEAGAVSFKIEGRLKDVDYVKNVVAAYSQRLNAVIAKYPDHYRRASYGRCNYTFTPNLKKTFSRGFTDYFLHGRQPDIVSFDTPKAVGEYVGRVKELRNSSFTVAGTASFANGDGLCFLNYDRELEGFRVNRAEGNRLFPLKMPARLHVGMALYRNHDVAFEKLLSGKSAERKIPVTMRLSETDYGFQLELSVADGRYAVANVPCEKQLAQKPQRDNIIRQLMKLGNTCYSCTDVDMENGVDKFFIPSSLLAELRRTAVEQTLISQPSSLNPHLSTLNPEPSTLNPEPSTLDPQPEYRQYPYLYNIANRQARAFYEQQGLETIEPAFELESRYGALLMQCRHCLRYTLGFCVKHGGRKPSWREPLYLELPDRRRFRLEFKCNLCQMNIYAE